MTVLIWDQECERKNECDILPASKGNARSYGHCLMALLQEMPEETPLGNAKIGCLKLDFMDTIPRQSGGHELLDVLTE
jgi:hypothetical protein